MKRRRSRQFTTHYHALGAQHPTSQGHAASARGAIRAAVVRIFEEEHDYAIVYDRTTWAVAYTIRIVSGALRVHYGTATGEKRRRR